MFRVMVPTRIHKSCLLHNAVLLGIQFNYLDQFTGDSGRYFMEKRKYQRLLVLDLRLIVWRLKIECYFFSYLHNIELHDGRRKEKDGKLNWGKTWKGRRKCGKQRGNYIQNQNINSNHTATKKHKKIIYLTNNKGVINV